MQAQSTFHQLTDEGKKLGLITIANLYSSS